MSHLFYWLWTSHIYITGFEQIIFILLLWTSHIILLALNKSYLFYCFEQVILFTDFQRIIYFTGYEQSCLFYWLWTSHNYFNDFEQVIFILLTLNKSKKSNSKTPMGETGYLCILGA